MDLGFWYCTYSICQLSQYIYKYWDSNAVNLICAKTNQLGGKGLAIIRWKKKWAEKKEWEHEDAQPPQNIKEAQEYLKFVFKDGLPRKQTVCKSHHTATPICARDKVSRGLATAINWWTWDQIFHHEKGTNSGRFTYQDT